MTKNKSKRQIKWFLPVILLLITGIYVFYTRVGFSAPPEDDSLHKTWTWVQTKTNDDKIVSPLKRGVFTIDLQSDGRVSITTDCNRAFGSYKVSADRRMSFSKISSTKMYCLDSQEMVFLEQLEQVGEYNLDEAGNLTLKLEDESGEMYFIE